MVLLQLTLEQVANHFPPRDPCRLPQRGKVKSARQAVGKAEEKHGGDPTAGIFESKAAVGHLVLLDVAAAQVVDASCRVDLGLVGSRDVGRLDAGENVEVVVGGVAAGVALGADGSAEDDEVLGDACLIVSKEILEAVPVLH